MRISIYNNNIRCSENESFIHQKKFITHNVLLKIIFEKSILYRPKQVVITWCQVLLIRQIYRNLPNKLQICVYMHVKYQSICAKRMLYIIYRIISFAGPLDVCSHVRQPQIQLPAQLLLRQQNAILSQVILRPISKALQVHKLLALLFAYFLSICILTDKNKIQQILSKVNHIQNEALNLFKSIST